VDNANQLAIGEEANKQAEGLVQQYVKDNPEIER